MAKLEIGKRYWLDETNTSHGVLISIEDDGQIMFDNVEGNHPYFDEDGRIGFYTDLEDESDFELYTA